MVCLLALAPRAQAAPLTMWDFAVYSGGGAAVNGATNPETRLGTNVTVNGLVGSNQDLHIVGGATVNANAVFVGGYLQTGTGSTIGSASLLADVFVNGANSSGANEADLHGDIFGNVFVSGDLAMGNNAAIHQVGGAGGNLTFTGNLAQAGGATVEGLIADVLSVTTFPLLTLPAPSSFAVSANAVDDRACTGAGCSSLSLAPGTYRNLNIGQQQDAGAHVGRLLLQPDRHQLGPDSQHRPVVWPAGQHLRAWRRQLRIQP